jgi:hypothetical protein
MNITEILEAHVPTIEEEYHVDTWEEGGKKALEAGFKIVPARKATVLLDLDTPEDVARYEAILERIQKPMGHAWGLKEVERWKSKSGVGTHVHLEMTSDLNEYERVALQALLGSDPVRELISLMRMRHGVTHPSRLFRPQGEVK